MFLHSVQSRMFTVAGTRRSVAVLDTRTVLAKHRVQPGCRVCVPPRSSVAPSRSTVTDVPVVHSQGAVPTDHHYRQSVAGGRADVVIRTAQPVVRRIVRQPSTSVSGQRVRHRIHSRHHERHRSLIARRGRRIP